MQYILVFSIAFLGVGMDLFVHKVLNHGILVFVVVGMVYRVWIQGGMGCLGYLRGGMVPLVLLFPLFVFRMLGPGDIKLLSVLGGIMGGEAILKCMMLSFVLGGVLSVAVIALCGNLVERLSYFIEYITQLINTKQIRPYYKAGMQMENIHFCVPILMSVMLYVGGLY